MPLIEVHQCCTLQLRNVAAVLARKAQQDRREPQARGLDHGLIVAVDGATSAQAWSNAW
jgi:hypothetical protein